MLYNNNDYMVVKLLKNGFLRKMNNIQHPSVIEHAYCSFPFAISISLMTNFIKGLKHEA